MGWCIYCEQEMTADTTVSCSGNEKIPLPEDPANPCQDKYLPTVPAIPYDPIDEDQKCPDCGVKSEGFHHPGCDQEKCPQCNCQLISCGCLEPQDAHD